MIPTNLRGCGHERLTVSTAALTLADIPEGATLALMRLKGTTGKGVCWTDDGTTPTSSVGMEEVVGDVCPKFWYLGELSKFQVIRRDDTDCTLIVTYYRP